MNTTKRILPIEVRPPEIVAREMTYPRRDIWILLGIGIAARLLMTCINEAEYTDGVLQALQFTQPVGIWPPLYSALIYPLHFVFGFEWSGRLVSAVASGIAVIPLYWMARRAFGTRAALYAGIFYLTAPVANRWGIRVMTEATFSLFFWWACERLCHAADERSQKVAFRSLALACVFTVLASLTRYQGLLLLGPVAACAFLVWKQFGKVPVKSLLWLSGLLILPVWIALTREGFIHGEQFSDRAFDAQMSSFKVLALNGEAFVAYMPYFLGYPVFLFAMVGSFWSRLRRGPYFGWLAFFVGIVLLVVQSLFSSFQERYFLPLMGFAWILAGAGLYALQERWCRPGRAWRERLFPYVLISVFGTSLAATVAVLIAQRQAFGDLARASRYAATLVPEDGVIYTNEIYRPKPVVIAGNKVEFYSKRRTDYLDESYLPGLQPGRPPVRTLAPGSILVLSSAYGGEAYEQALATRYRMVQLPQDGAPGDRVFAADLMPLLPEIMETPGTAQNPLAWMFRYEWQHFTTKVYRIESVR